MLQNFLSRLPHHESMGNLSEGNISDTISESSDNATLLSLSREDLVALGAGSVREDVRVNRKKMEALIIRERDFPTGIHYMDALMKRTNTYIQWPSRMKIGAKTKKDLYVRIYGHNQDEVDEAKNQILNDLGPHRDLRITLKMEISYTDHSHLIGCRGQTIRKVMDDTGCHIHFPDSNRMSKEHKSNQVTIAGGSVGAVEQARSRVRELSPLVFQFCLPSLHSPYEMQMNPDAHHVFIEDVQAKYGVQVTIHPPNKLQQTTISVKGCEIDAHSVKKAVKKILEHFSGNVNLNALQVESTLEVSAVQHPFVRALNDSNVYAIMMNTGAKIIFPDLSDANIQQIKRSRVYISGDINCVYNARQQLLGCLPLRMIFDLADDLRLDWESIRNIGSELNVNVKMINRNRNSDRQGGLNSLPPPVPGRSRTIQLITHERNTSNLYEVRRRILGGNEPQIQASVPGSYMLQPVYSTPDMKGSMPDRNRLALPLGSLPPLMLPASPNMLSPLLSPSFWPPNPFSSPFVSPTFTTCVMTPGHHQHGHGAPGHNPGGHNNHHNGSAQMAREGQGGPPPGLPKLTLNLQHPHAMGYTSGLPSPSPVNPHPPTEFNMNALKQSFHLPLMDPNMNMSMNHNMNMNHHNMNHSMNQHQHNQGPAEPLKSPMGMGGTWVFSDLSLMTMHPTTNESDEFNN